MSSGQASQALFHYLTADRVVPLLQGLLRIPSAASVEGEGAVADYIVARLRDAGLPVDVQEALPGRPNVVASLGAGTGPTLLFNAHMDVVPAGEGWTRPAYGGAVEDGRVYGRGAVDDKGPLAAMLAATLALHELRLPLRGRLVMCAVVDEEQASLGSRILMKTLRGDLGLVGEPTGGDVVLAHNGSLRPMLKVIGRAAHTSRPEEGVNAISKMAQVVGAVDRWHRQLRRRRHPLTGSASAAVSLICGGDQPNVIPELCHALVDRRLIPGETEEQALTELRAMFDRLAQKDPALRVEIDHLVPTTGGPAETRRDSPIVELVCSAAREALGREPKLTGLGGACDMVHLASAGVPTVVFGPGDPRQAHKPDEHIEIQALVECARAYGLVAVRALA